MICGVFADIAHPVERHLAKVEVASSSLVVRSIKKRFAGSLFCPQILYGAIAKW